MESHNRPPPAQRPPSWSAQGGQTAAKPWTRQTSSWSSHMYGSTQNSRHSPNTRERYQEADLSPSLATSMSWGMGAPAQQAGRQPQQLPFSWANIAFEEAVEEIARAREDHQIAGGGGSSASPAARAAHRRQRIQQSRHRDAETKLELTQYVETLSHCIFVYLSSSENDCGRGLRLRLPSA